MFSFRHRFSHGVHPRQNKEFTVDLPIQRVPFVGRYVLPLDQHLGVPAQATVNVGERVWRGQRIARPGGFVSTALHSPVTGKVTAIEPRRAPAGKFSPSIEIQADPFSTQRLTPNPPIDWASLSLEEFIHHIQWAGIVGLGGAAFPCHVKYSMPEGKKIEYLLINGAECEPYLTNDHRLMLERPATLLRGIAIVKRKLGARRAIIGIETNKPGAISTLRGQIKQAYQIEVMPLPVKYPQGAERMLIKTVFGRELPPTKLPRDIGVAVNNVSSLVAIADYFDSGLPLIERIVTVSGSGVTYPANLIVPIGTPLREVLRFCGGLRETTKSVIMGGPMMGQPISSLDIPIVKGTSGILAFTDKEDNATHELPCIRCGRCLAACPHFLNPSRLGRLAKARRFDEMRAYRLTDCVECGSCSYACPSEIPLVQLIRTAKRESHKR
ncbi:MAG: electron transport complex protein RnfC [Candidatus Kentron sp. G]|nr:MAG: electron transport complex protein RnfC [Candidatus Kentron sp. G]VFM97770.1 MAG: electron transport complex protein RnfC [Candidatus Kentron sp. G]VFN00237.1 MAG: electron transport complex protein RnfC [Candidatus Kentron sp. G]